MLENTISFLKKLKRNNNREWFNANKAFYEQAKAEINQFTLDCIQLIGEFDKDIAPLNPKDCIFRIFRDARFSKDKTPYKENMGIYFARGGKKSKYAGYYIHIQPGGSFIAGGLWMPESSVLNIVRDEIHFNHKQLRKILSQKDFKRDFQGLEDHRLKTLPKGYEKDHPAIDLLKYKSFIATYPFSDQDISGKKFLDVMISKVRYLHPLVHFLNEAIDMKDE